MNYSGFGLALFKGVRFSFSACIHLACPELCLLERTFIVQVVCVQNRGCSEDYKICIVILRTSNKDLPLPQKYSFKTKIGVIISIII